MKVRSTVRLREEWELQCPDCQQYLPLDLEFWDRRRGMTRCRFCWRRHVADQKKALYRESPEYAERQRERARRYRQETGYEHTRSRLRWQEVKNDPLLLELHRERNRLAMRRYRARRKAAA